MCYHFQSSDMLEWLKTQVRVIEAWREDVASRPDLDLEMITRLERHYQWLTAEVLNLEERPARRVGTSKFRVLRAV
ncbi:MAG: hypothetical protein NXH78_14885 [Hyphomonadaceae bacterium]|nr:hypothetical protein [Hyphomonadaceae bacterium]